MGKKWIRTIPVQFKCVAINYKFEEKNTRFCWLWFFLAINNSKRKQYFWKWCNVIIFCHYLFKKKIERKIIQKHTTVVATNTTITHIQACVYMQICCGCHRVAVISCCIWLCWVCSWWAYKKCVANSIIILKIASINKFWIVWTEKNVLICNIFTRTHFISLSMFNYRMLVTFWVIWRYRPISMADMLHWLKYWKN